MSFLFRVEVRTASFNLSCGFFVSCPSWNFCHQFSSCTKDTLPPVLFCRVFPHVHPVVLTGHTCSLFVIISLSKNSTGFPLFSARSSSSSRFLLSFNSRFISPSLVIEDQKCLWGAEDLQFISKWVRKGSFYRVETVFLRKAGRQWRISSSTMHDITKPFKEFGGINST